MFNLFVFAGVVTGQHEELAHQDQLYQGPRAITGTVSGSLLSSLGGECHHGCQFTAIIYYNLIRSVCGQRTLVGRRPKGC